MSNWQNEILWNEQGLVPVIVQDGDSKQVLMHAWMNHESLARTVETGKAVFWSRSRKKLWTKGESSGHYQLVESIRIDCDGDTLLLTVKQQGGIACHTGRAHCFYRLLDKDDWQTTDPVLKEPDEIYNK